MVAITNALNLRKRRILNGLPKNKKTLNHQNFSFYITLRNKEKVNILVLLFFIHIHT